MDFPLEPSRVPNWTIPPKGVPMPPASPGAALAQGSGLRSAVKNFFDVGSSLDPQGKTGSIAKRVLAAPGNGVRYLARNAPGLSAAGFAVDAYNDAKNTFSDPNATGIDKAAKGAEIAARGAGAYLGGAAGRVLGLVKGPAGSLAGGVAGAAAGDQAVQGVIGGLRGWADKATDYLAFRNLPAEFRGETPGPGVHFPPTDAMGHPTGPGEPDLSRPAIAPIVPAAQAAKAAGPNPVAPYNPAADGSDAHINRIKPLRDFSSELATLPSQSRMPSDMPSGQIFKTKDANGRTVYSGKGDIAADAPMVNGVGRDINPGGTVSTVGNLRSGGSGAYGVANVLYDNPASPSSTAGYTGMIDGREPGFSLSAGSGGGGAVGFNGSRLNNSSSTGSGSQRMDLSDIASAAQKIGLRGATAMAQQQLGNDNAIRTALINQATQLQTTGMNNDTSLRTNAATNATHLQTTGMNNGVTLRGQDLDYGARMLPIQLKMAGAEQAGALLRDPRFKGDANAAANFAAANGKPYAAEMLRENAGKDQTYSEGQRKAFDTSVDSMVGTVKGADGKDTPDAELAQMVRGNLLRQNPDIIRLSPDQQQALIAAELPNQRALRAANQDNVRRNLWERWTGGGPLKHAAMPDASQIVKVETASPNPFRGTSTGDPILHWRDASGNVQQMPIPKDQMDSPLLKHYMDAAARNAQKGK